MKLQGTLSSTSPRDLRTRRELAICRAPRRTSRAARAAIELQRPRADLIKSFLHQAIAVHQQEQEHPRNGAMLHARLVLLLTLAPMACALRRRPNLIVSDRGGVAARGGADADADGGSLFGGDEADGDGLLGGDADADGLLGGDDADAESEEDATKRYAAAVKAAREQGGDCPALDAFETRRGDRGRLGDAAVASRTRAGRVADATVASRRGRDADAGSRPSRRSLIATRR